MYLSAWEKTFYSTSRDYFPQYRKNVCKSEGKN